MKYNSYTHHLKKVHDIKIGAKSSLDKLQISEEVLERTKEFQEKLAMESHDTQVLKQALLNAVKSDYLRGSGLRHYINKPPPIPVDGTNETIK